jgi:peptidoglycan/LPS O-acetylase OafA/YrhL
MAFHVYHYGFQQWQPNPNAGWAALIIEGHTGVALFFVLSGFLFMLIALNGAIHYKKFIYNRFVRVFPLFLVFFMLAVTLGRDDFQATDIFYVVFTNLGSPPTSDFFVTGPAWTISVEFSFYLLFPFIAASFISYGLRYMLGLLVLLFFLKLVVFLHVNDPIHVLYSTLIGRLDQFLIGMVAAVTFLNYREWLEKYACLVLFLAAVLLFFLLWYLAVNASWAGEERHHLWWLFWSSIEASAWAGVVVSYMCVPQCRSTFIGVLAKVAGYIGKISFSAYLLHASVIFILYDLLFNFKFTDFFYVNFLLSFSMVCILTVLSNNLSTTHKSVRQSGTDVEEPVIGSLTYV